MKSVKAFWKRSFEVDESSGFSMADISFDPAVAARLNELPVIDHPTAEPTVLGASDTSRREVREYRPVIDPSRAESRVLEVSEPTRHQVRESLLVTDLQKTLPRVPQASKPLRNQMRENLRVTDLPKEGSRIPAASKPPENQVRVNLPVTDLPKADPTVSKASSLEASNPPVEEVRHWKMAEGTTQPAALEAIKLAKEQETAVLERLKMQGKAADMPPYHFLKLIGKGTYGRVYLAEHVEFRNLVAIKVIDADAVDYLVPFNERNESFEGFLHEVTVLEQLKGFKAQNVNEIKDVFVIHSQLWIITEYCPGGSARTLMYAGGRKGLQEVFIRIIARETAKGLKAIHNANIVHRDLKAANIMIHENGGLQIIDFGVSGLLAGKHDKRSTFIGTYNWMPPELLFGKKSGIKGDTWSFGATIYELVKGHPPMHDVPPGIAFEKRLKRRAPRLKVEDGVSQLLCEMVECALVIDENDRPTMEELLEHPYFQDEAEHPISLLAELVKTFRNWEETGGQRQSLFLPIGADAPQGPDQKQDEQPNWRFSTIDPNATRFSTVDTSETIRQQLADVSLSDASDLGAQVPPASSSNYLAPSSLAHLAEAHSDESYSLKPNVYTPKASPRFQSNTEEQGSASQIPVARVMTDQDPAKEDRIKRAEKGFEGLFDENKPAYKYGPKSDLPLRNQDVGPSGVQRKELDATMTPSSSGNNVPNIDLASVDAIKEKRLKQRETMDWQMPEWNGPGPAAATTQEASPPSVRLAPPPSGPPKDDLDFSFGSPGDEIEEISHESGYTGFEPAQQSNLLAPRPILARAETAPVFSPPSGFTSTGDDIGSRSSRFDMDAYMEDLEPPTMISAPDNATSRVSRFDMDAYMEGLNPPAMISAVDDSSSRASRFDLDAYMRGADLDDYHIPALESGSSSYGEASNDEYLTSTLKTTEREAHLEEAGRDPTGAEEATNIQSFEDWENNRSQATMNGNENEFSSSLGYEDYGKIVYPVTVVTTALTEDAPNRVLRAELRRLANEWVGGLDDNGQAWERVIADLDAELDELDGSEDGSEDEDGAEADEDEEDN